MAVRETTIFQRTNTASVWPFEYMEANFSGTVVSTDSGTAISSTASEDGLTQTIIKEWSSVSNFASFKADQNDQWIQEFFTYLSDNNITFTRTVSFV